MNGLMNVKPEEEQTMLELKTMDIETVPNLSTGKGFELTQRIAYMLSKSSIVPKDYQGNLPNCIVALNMANRLGADPLMVMQNLYIVYGRPSWSSTFLISAINTCGHYSALRFEFSGKENTDEWGCRAWAIELNENERLDGTLITIGMAKKEGWFTKSGSKWQTMPEQMLRYRAAAFFSRIYCPEITMGMQTSEEIIDIEPNQPVVSQTPIPITQIIKDAKISNVKPQTETPKQSTKQDEHKLSSKLQKAIEKLESAENKSELGAYYSALKLEISDDEKEIFESEYNSLLNKLQ